MKTHLPNSVSAERGGAVAFVVVIIAVVLLLVGTATLFLGATRVSTPAIAASVTPAPSPTFSLSWKFTEPEVTASDGRWSVATDLALTAADPVVVKDMKATVVRGARRVRGDVVQGPPADATNQCSLEFGFDEVPGAVAPTLEVTFTAVMADGVVTQHMHRMDLTVE